MICEIVLSLIALTIPPSDVWSTAGQVGWSMLPSNPRSTITRVRVGGNVKQPKKIVDVRAVYPDSARTAGIQGIVILRVVIGEDGSIVDAQVVRSIPELDQAAIDAVRQWRYEPTLLNGEPVEVEMNVTIRFTLN